MTTISDELLPILADRFPGQGDVFQGAADPCIRFPAIHPDVGDILIYDDDLEITLFAGNFTHVYFYNDEDISNEESKRQIACEVADFLEKLFADQVLLWGSHDGIGGHRVLAAGAPGGATANEYVWSGPAKHSQRRAEHPLALAKKRLIVRRKHHRYVIAAWIVVLPPLCFRLLTPYELWHYGLLGLWAAAVGGALLWLWRHDARRCQEQG